MNRIADDVWILASKGNRWVEIFLKSAMRHQPLILYDFPEERRRQGYGRAAKVIVDGQNGGIFLLWFCEEGLQPKPPEVPIKNNLYMTEDTLLDMAIPSVDIETLVTLVDKEGMEGAIYQLYPRLDFRTAYANRLISIDGDKPDVDSEEWAQITDKFHLKIAFPITVPGLVKKGRERKGK